MDTTNPAPPTSIHWNNLTLRRVLAVAVPLVLAASGLGLRSLDQTHHLYLPPGLPVLSWILLLLAPCVLLLLGLWAWYQPLARLAVGAIALLLVLVVATAWAGSWTLTGGERTATLVADSPDGQFQLAVERYTTVIDPATGEPETVHCFRDACD